MAHTPGPWRVGTLRGNDGSHRIMSDNGRVGTVDYGGEYRSGKTIISDAPDPLGLDNARLIAAAPELLAALKDALERMDNDETTIKHYRHVIDATESAIAKAEGR